MKTPGAREPPGVDRLGYWTAPGALFSAGFCAGGLRAARALRRGGGEFLGFFVEVIQDRVGLNRAKVRVAADLSGEGLENIKQEEAVEKAMADNALRQFEIDMGMVTPETAGVKADDKELGSERITQKTT